MREHLPRLLTEAPIIPWKAEIMHALGDKSLDASDHDFGNPLSRENPDTTQEETAILDKIIENYRSSQYA
ncbi:hypothetical protein AA105894_1742 [Asaia spathodeae NBRC 105894]|nr:hypothetical protein AA105894_1742 [Asaia spathodeae NBRC 105894]